MKDARLIRKINEIVTLAEDNDWLVATDESTATVEGCSEVVLVGGAFIVRRPDTDKSFDIQFAMGLAVNERTNRIVTLRQDPEEAAFVIYADDGSGRYWYSKKASAWKSALVDPFAWCEGL